MPLGIEECPSGEWMGTFDEAKIEFNFSQPTYKILDDADVSLPDGEIAEWQLLRYVTVRETPAARYQTVPRNSGLRWVDGTAGVPPGTFGTAATGIGAFIILAESDVTLVWEQVPLDAFTGANSTALVGKINNPNFSHADSLLRVKDLDTLLFGAPGKEVYRHNGEQYYRITYKFRWFPQGANFFFRVENVAAGVNPQFQLLTCDGQSTGGRLFPRNDFKYLFRVGA